MAVKQERIQGKQVYAYVDSTPTRRIQTLDYNSNFTIDSVFELGNAGIVEDSVSLVETGITLNSNEWGSTDLEAMLFGIYEQRNLRKVTGVGNTTTKLCVSSRGAGGRWTAVATTGAAGTFWVQLIRLHSFATTNAVEYAKVTGCHYRAASQANFLTISPALSAAPTAGDIVTLVNKYTIDQDTVDSNPVHFVLPHRYSSSSTLMMHSIILPRCYVDNLTYRIDTGGAAEQNYSLVGEEERMLLNSRREAQSIAGSFISYTNGTGLLKFTIPESSLSATASPYIVYAASNLATMKYIGHTSGQVTVQATLSAGLGIDSNTPIVYYSTNKVKQGYKPLTNIDSGIGKLTKGYVEITLQGSVGAAYKLLRCTGIDISIPLTRESIDELGTSTSIGKPLEGNLRNEITLTFNRNDLKEYAYINGDATAWDAATLKEILMVDLKSIKDVIIIVKLYNSQKTHSASTLLKTVTFNNCNFIGDTSSTTTTGAANLELKFSTSELSIVGSGKPPIYS